MAGLRFSFSTPEPTEASAPIEWAKTVGTIINNTHRGYWLSKSDTEHGFDESFERLEQVLQSLPQVTLSVFKESLQINEETAPDSHPMLQVLTEHLVHCEITDFSISRGMTRQDYGRFLDILSMKPLEIGIKGGFVKLVTDAQLPCVRVLKVVYKRVAENETVVSQDTLKAASAGLGEAITRQMMEIFSKSETTATAPIDALTVISQDPGKMAGLILDAVQQDPFSVSSDNPHAAVAECVQRAFDRLMTDPAMKTQKGKKALARLLSQIENEIAGTIGSESEAAKALHEAVESMQDELQMETIAAEYVKKRKAIEASEERILRYMRAKGLDRLAESELGGKLTEMGLDAGGWGDLMGKSGLTARSGFSLSSAPPPVPGAAAFTSLTLNHLASLIDHIETQLTAIETTAATPSTSGREQAHAVAATIADASRDVQRVLDHTEDKVRTLVQSLNEDEGMVREMELLAQAKGQGLQLSRRRLMEILAEIVQEICQPLAVINCSLDLVMSRALGQIPDEPLDMLKMAKESADRTLVIVEQLKDISGMPETRSPDQKILGDMYSQHGLDLNA